MSLLTDMLAALDRWEEWKRMRAAPDRIDALEAQIAELAARPPKDACAFCESTDTRPSGHPSVDKGVVRQDRICNVCDKRFSTFRKV